MNKDITDGFGPGDDEKVIEILKKWKGGRLSNELFTELAGILPAPCIESVILRKNEGKVEVLLIPRPENDIVWKGMLHSPGASIRRSDYQNNPEDAFTETLKRIEDQEIKNKFEEKPRFITSYSIMTKRGPEVVLLFLAKISDRAVLPEGSGWYDIENLNEIPNFLSHQTKAIEEAAKVFNG
jgi:hypothetical protein